jgi:hypothetical protein
MLIVHPHAQDLFIHICAYLSFHVCFIVGDVSKFVAWSEQHLWQLWYDVFEAFQWLEHQLTADESSAEGVPTFGGDRGGHNPPDWCGKTEHRCLTCA